MYPRLMYPDLISDVSRASHLVLAAPTCNNGLYPKMANFIEDMKALNVQNRTVSIIENGSWAPQSGKTCGPCWAK